MVKLNLERQETTKIEELLKTYSQPFSKHELGDILESVVEEGFKKLGLRYFIAYRDNQQGSHPDFVVYIWYKHQRFIIAIECHNYHLHYLVPQSWAKRNSIDKFESLTVKADGKVVFGSVMYSQPSKKLIKEHGVENWQTPDVTETKETFKGAVKLFIAYLLKWITDMTSELYRENLLGVLSLSIFRVNNRFSILPYPNHKVIYEEYTKDVEDG